MIFMHSSSDRYISVARRSPGARRTWLCCSRSLRDASSIWQWVWCGHPAGTQRATNHPAPCGSRSLVMVRTSSDCCGTGIRDHDKLQNALLAAGTGGLVDVHAFFDSKPSRGSVHHQRDVVPLPRHYEHSAVDAVAEQRALELPLALGGMYREEPANVAATHAVTLTRTCGSKDARRSGGRARGRCTRLFEGCGRSWEPGARSGVISCHRVSLSGRLGPKEA